jgi:hypothetical protein
MDKPVLLIPKASTPMGFCLFAGGTASIRLMFTVIGKKEFWNSG